MATRKSPNARASKESDVAPVFDTSVLYRDILHQVEKLVGSSDNMDDVTPLSTGSVTHDLMLGGGILPAMYTNSGWEQTGKTTDALHAMASSISSDIDVIAFFDAEGSTRNSIPYLTNILRGAGVNLDKHELFGRKDSNGSVLQHGRVYYRTVTRGLVFFNWLAATLNRAPDKVRVNEKWYLKYPKTKEFAAYQKHHDTSTKRTDGIYIPAKHGGLAGIVFVDSWANLNPESKDTDDEDRALAAQARMFSAGLKRVKGLLASKKFAIYGINQLSAIPMAMFGPKEDEKGGNALKYNSDARTRFTQRALSGAPLWPTESKNRKGFEVERAIDGGVDAYRYVTMRTIKNKLAPAQREAWMRIWVRDSTGAGRGIDPVFDHIYYLYLTGQLIAGGRDARNNMRLNLDKKGLSEYLITWDDMKLWILGSKQQAAEICKAQGLKPFSLRAFCRNQVSSGRGEELYNMAESKASKPASAKEE